MIEHHTVQVEALEDYIKILETEYTNLESRAVVSRPGERKDYYRSHSFVSEACEKKVQDTEPHRAQDRKRGSVFRAFFRRRNE